MAWYRLGIDVVLEQHHLLTFTTHHCHLVLCPHRAVERVLTLDYH